MDRNELMNKVVEWVGQTAEKIGDFAAKEIPPFVQEYLTWKFWENAIGVVGHFINLGFIIIATLAVIWGVKRFWKKHVEKPHEDWEIGSIILGIFGGLASLILTVVWIVNFPVNKVLDCVQIKIAPKVYLVEKAAEIYKENK